MKSNHASIRTRKPYKRDIINAQNKNPSHIKITREVANNNVEGKGEIQKKSKTKIHEYLQKTDREASLCDEL